MHLPCCDFHSCFTPMTSIYVIRVQQGDCRLTDRHTQADRKTGPILLPRPLTCHLRRLQFETFWWEAQNYFQLISLTLMDLPPNHMSILKVPLNWTERVSCQTKFENKWDGIKLHASIYGQWEIPAQSIAIHVEASDQDMPYGSCQK